MSGILQTHWLHGLSMMQRHGLENDKNYYSSHGACGGVGRDLSFCTRPPKKLAYSKAGSDPRSSSDGGGKEPKSCFNKCRQGKRNDAR